MSATPFGQDYYARNYRDYEAQNPARKLRYYARVIERHRDPLAPKRIHDVGCAFGRFLATLPADWQLCGSDPSEHAIARAAQVVPRAAFRMASAAQPCPFEGKFGVVCAFDTLEHVEDLDAAGAAVHDQLVAGGLFVFVVPVYDGLSGPLIRWLDRDPTHVHKLPRRRWLEWAARGFEVVAWWGVLRYLLPGRHYAHVPTKLLRHHTPAIITVCRRRLGEPGRRKPD